MIKNYLKTAFRNLWRTKAFSVINIAGLSVALGCCMLILLYAMDEVSYDRFNVNASKIYHLVVEDINPQGVSNKMSSTGPVPGPTFKRQIPEIENFVRIYGGNLTAKRGADVFSEDMLFVDSNFFSVFTAPLKSGSYKNALAGDHTVVISEDVAKKYFGDKNAIGQIMTLKQGKTFEPYTVTAVTKRSPQNSSLKIKMLLPFKATGFAYKDNQWFNFYLNTFFTIKPGSDIRRIEAKIAKIFKTESAEQFKEMAQKYGMKDKTIYHLQPLLGIHTSTEYPADNGLSDASNPMYSYILTGIALFILLIACINFVNLTVARSLKRAKEIGIRKVVGGERKQLIIQFLGESYILCFVAFVLAIALVWLGLPTFNTLANKALAFSYLLSFKLVAGYIAIFLLTGLLAGFYPALVLSGFNPVQTLYNRHKHTGKNYLSKSLVVLQFTLATFFIIATITIYSQFNYLMHFDLGYNDQNVVSIKSFDLDRKVLPTFKNELLKNPNIKMVTADEGGRWGTIAKINNGQQTQFDIKHVDEDYLPLFEIPVRQGRNFSKSMISDTANSILVNEAFAKQAGWKKPIGQVVDFFYDHKKYTVIGIVKDYHFLDLTQKVSPIMFRMKPQDSFGNVFIKISGQNQATTLNYVEKTFKELFPFRPYESTFKDAEIAQQYDKEAKWKQIVTFSAILTIFISCIGLFGLATLSAERRKKEIGIRKVLGASVEIIVSKLSTDFLKLVIISALIASPAAWWAVSKWLQNYPYRVAVNSWIFISASVAVLLVALLTVSYHAIRAAIANPVKSLRSE